MRRAESVRILALRRLTGRCRTLGDRFPARPATSSREFPRRYGTSHSTHEADGQRLPSTTSRRRTWATASGRRCTSTRAEVDVAGVSHQPHHLVVGVGVAICVKRVPRAPPAPSGRLNVTPLADRELEAYTYSRRPGASMCCPWRGLTVQSVGLRVRHCDPRFSDARVRGLEVKGIAIGVANGPIHALCGQFDRLASEEFYGTRAIHISSRISSRADRDRDRVRGGGANPQIPVGHLEADLLSRKRRLPWS